MSNIEHKYDKNVINKYTYFIPIHVVTVISNNITYYVLDTQNWFQVLT